MGDGRHWDSYDSLVFTERRYDQIVASTLELDNLTTYRSASRDCGRGDATSFEALGITSKSRPVFPQQLTTWCAARTGETGPEAVVSSMSTGKEP